MNKCLHKENWTLMWNLKKGRENYREVDVVNLNSKIRSRAISGSLMSPCKFYTRFAFLATVQNTSEMKSNELK